MDSTKLNTSLITDYFSPAKDGESNHSSPLKVLESVFSKELLADSSTSLAQSAASLAESSSALTESSASLAESSATLLESSVLPAESFVLLAESSVLLTPKSTPDKGDHKTEHLDKNNELTANTTSNELKAELACGSTDLKKEPTCKKTLTNKLDREVESVPHKTPSRRKGHKNKQQKGIETELTNEETSKAPVKAKASRKKKTTESDGLKNTLVTDYFHVRRSDRKSKSDIQKEREIELHQKILNGCEDGLEIVEIENKGRGVIATKVFHRGDFVVEYAGDLIDLTEAKRRDSKYTKDPTKGCYMYYFNFKNKNYCIDATEESGKLGRLLNHSKTIGNCHTKIIDVKDHPYLILLASRDINKGEELMYDYGDRSKQALASHPWLKT